MPVCTRALHQQLSQRRGLLVAAVHSDGDRADQVVLLGHGWAHKLDSSHAPHEAARRSFIAAPEGRHPRLGGRAVQGLSIKKREASSLDTELVVEFLQTGVAHEAECVAFHPPRPGQRRRLQPPDVDHIGVIGAHLVVKLNALFRWRPLPDSDKVIS